MTHSKYSIAVDLGESNVTVVAGRRGEDGMIEIAAIAKRKTRGLRAGRIENIAQVNGALSGAIADIEATLEVKVCQAYGGLSGEFIRCGHHAETVIVEEPNSGVANTDVVALHNLMRDVLAPSSDMILEYVPQNYMVDGRREVKDPVGSFCRSLSSTYNFTICDKEAIKRLSLAFMQAGFGLKRCFANSVMAAEAVISNDEREVGVAVVDLGEGITNISIYHKGALRYMASIPIGGSAINRDLKSLMVHEKNVEDIKLKYGCAIAKYSDSGSVPIEGRTLRDRHNIPIYNIAVAIEQRLTDIAIFIQREIRDAGYDGRLPYGLILTGGGANLPNVDDLLRHILGVDVRIATPENDLSLESLRTVSAPEYATVIGILKRAIDVDATGAGKSCTVNVNEDPEPDIEESIFGKTPDGKFTQSKLDLEGDDKENKDSDDDDDDDEKEEMEDGRNRSKSKSHRSGGLLKFIKEKVNKLLSSDVEEKF
ncbi:MAG: cell division protein FtsA [Rikenellaceae bacterium]